MMTCSICVRHGLAGVPAVALLASGAAAGPVLLVGDAADSHASTNVYAGLVHETISNVTNGQLGILAVGVDPGSEASDWILGVSALLPQPQLVAFANDETIGVIGLSGYAVIYVPSPASYTDGGITQGESDLLNSRAGDIANFLDGGGGLVALTQGNLNDPYGFLGDFATVETIAVGPSGTCGKGSLFDNITPTDVGTLFGITDSNLDGCCWGNVYTSFPEELTVLAAAEVPGCPAIDGIASVLIGFVDIPEIGFDPPEITPAVGEPTSHKVGDLDGNGTPDVVAVIPGTDPDMPGSIQVFLNQGVDGDGIWLGLVANTEIQVGNNPSDVAVGFYNNDTDLDIAVTNANSDSVWIFFNDGAGNFTFSQDVFTGDQPRAITAADLNEDGFVDLAVANALDENVVFLFNDSTGMFLPPAPAESALVPLGVRTTAMLSGDFDGNKCPDVAGAGSDQAVGFADGEPPPGVVFVLLGMGGGVFAPPVFYDVGQNPSDIAIGDLNSDGFPDLAITDSDDDTVSILINLQDGSFAPRFTEDVGQAPSSLVIEDLNLDARPDIAVAADDLQIGPAVQVLENQLEAGDGGTIPFNNPIPFDVGGDPNFVASADFNSDGLPDIVTANQDKSPDGGSVAVLLNNPPPPPCPGDFTGDGFVNVVDFLDLLAHWGPCPSGASCPWDLNGDEVVDVSDLLDVLFSWGICAGEACPWDLNGDGVVNGQDVAELVQSFGDCEDPDDCPADLDGDGQVGLLDLWILLLHMGDCE